jgi:hypothetical protein
MDQELIGLIAVIAASVSTAIALVATIIGYFAFRSQVDPEVIVYLRHDERRPSIMLLIIENIGKGAALNVRFTTSKPLPMEAFGMTEKEALPFVKMDRGAIVTGIPFLEPGGKRICTWGQYGGLKRHLGEGICITVHYKHRQPGWPFRRSKKGTFPLELTSFALGDASDTNWDKHAADNLKEISDTLKKLARS